MPLPKGSCKRHFATADLGEREGMRPKEVPLGDIPSFCYKLLVSYALEQTASAYSPIEVPVQCVGTGL